MRRIAVGAEAVLYRSNGIIKDRVKKGYRIPQIDRMLRRQRTRREAKILTKLEGFPAPRLISSDDESVIVMTELQGEKLRDVLAASNAARLGKDIGRKVATLHNKGIIHADLTTSNMIVDKEVQLIDFGLSFFSEKVEDKAVDLHLLRQALESKHSAVWKKCFAAVLKAYSETAKDGSLVIKRLDEVERRGRYKRKAKGI